MSTLSRLIVIAGVLLLSGCSVSDEGPAHVGYVEAEWIYIAAPESGWLVQRLVREGMRVEPDQLLFELDTDLQEANLDEAHARVAQAEADVRDLSLGARPDEVRRLEADLAETAARLEQARSERDRVVPLVTRGIESLNRGDQVEANYQAAIAAADSARQAIKVAKLASRSNVQDRATAVARSAEAGRASAQWQLSQRKVVARSAGRIEEVFHHPGEFVTAGSPVLAILPDDGLKVRFFVSEKELVNHEVGEIVRVRADGLATAIEARVSFIASEAEFTPPVVYSKDARDKLVFLVEARLPPGSGLHPGLPVDVDGS